MLFVVCVLCLEDDYYFLHFRRASQRQRYYNVYVEEYTIRFRNADADAEAGYLCS